jgi:ABC-type transport system substrate-binding protein
VPTNDFFAETYAGKLSSSFSVYYAVSPDPSILPSYLFGSASTINSSQYKPPVIDHLLDAGLATADPAQRLAIYGQILKQVGSDVPYVPLYQPKNFVALAGPLTLPTPSTFPAFRSWALAVGRGQE